MATGRLCCTLPRCPGVPRRQGRRALSLLAMRTMLPQEVGMEVSAVVLRVVRRRRRMPWLSLVMPPTLSFQQQHQQR